MKLRLKNRCRRCGAFLSVEDAEAPPLPERVRPKIINWLWAAFILANCLTVFAGLMAVFKGRLS